MSVTREPTPCTESEPHAARMTKHRRVFGWGLALVNAGLCVALAASAPDEIVAAFERVRFVPAALALSMILLTRVLDAWLLINLFADETSALDFRRAVRIVTFQNLSAFVAPKSGIVAAGAVLRIEHGVGIARFTGLQIAAIAIKVVITACIGLLAAIMMRLGTPSGPLATEQNAVIIGLASLPPLVVLAYLIASGLGPSTEARGWFRRGLSDAWLGITSILHDRARLVRIIVISTITAAAKIIGFSLIVYGVLGSIDQPLGVVVVSTASEIGTALSFTPAGLGVREAMAGITAGFAGLTPPLMIGIALVDRVLMLLATGILAPTLCFRTTHTTPHPPLD